MNRLTKKPLVWTIEKCTNTLDFKTQHVYRCWNNVEYMFDGDVSQYPLCN